MCSYERASDLDLARYVRAGDMVVWGQGCAQPLSLIGRLLAQRAEIGPFRCFVGMSATSPLTEEHLDYVFAVSYTGSGGNRWLHQAGGLDILPCHYSQLLAVFSRGALRADVVLLQVPPPDRHGRYSFGLANEYLSAAIAAARVVIAEINEAVPWTYGATLGPEDIDVVVASDTSVTSVLSPGADAIVGQMPRTPPGEIERRIAKQVAGLIEDGSTLQLGMGKVPEGVLSALSGHQDLGIHSGLIGDGVVELVEQGVVTNARKSLDRYRTVAGLLVGSQELFRFAHRNPEVELRDTAYTHDPQVLEAQERFVAINSAIEVDLTGQVNAETVDGRYVGAVGGAADFLRGAHRSRGGLPIIALPSTAGVRTRIVTHLSGPTSTARSDAGIVVTEFGVADLRGQPLRARQERMLAIAHPEHRQHLEAELSAPGRLQAMGGRPTP